MNKIHFVGAGSGAPDLITVRGMNLIREADLIVYAGSLVNPELLSYAEHHPVIHNSAEMHLEQIIEIMAEAYAKGMKVVRLHTGDPCLYGAVRERYCALWTQIAAEFASYGERLLFESFNEMLDADGTWNYSTSGAHDVINRYNADFVATVRSTGGNNAHRNLILNTYAASSLTQVLQDFVLPDDSVEDHLLAEVHSYAPYQFAFDVESGAREEFDEWCAREVRRQIENVYTGFVSKGIPCVIGEYGCTSNRAEAEIAKQVACYVSAAAPYDIPCFCWMLLSDGSDRAVPTWTMPDVKDAIIKAYQENRNQ